MSRPKFTISRHRLRDLREESGKTQLLVAMEVHALIGKNHPSTDATLRNDYQRIERSGRTSRQRAEALAAIFGVSLEVLTGKDGPEPFDYLKQIETLLRERLQAGGNTALVRALEYGSGSSEITDQGIGRLAMDIGQSIESAQLGRNPSVIAELAELTGLPEEELLKPANVLGHWLVIATGTGANRTDFVHGASDLAWHIREIVGDRLNSRGSDGSVRMFRDDPWFRIEIRRTGHRHDLTRIDFVRCNPADGSGIRWAKATWRERFQFEDAIKYWAYGAANFVTDFDGVQSPGDLRRLRFLVTEFDGVVWRTTGRMSVSGNLEEMDDELLASFEAENATHALTQSWLTNGLIEALAPHVAEFPSECWSVSVGARLEISLNERKAKTRPIHECFIGVKYRVELAEEIGDKRFSPVPWREIDATRLCETVKKELADPDGRFWRPSGERVPFEPFEAEK